MKKVSLVFAAVFLFIGTAGTLWADPYADELISYTMGSGGVYHDHRAPTNALRAPNYVDDKSNYVSLGWGGSIVLKFADNYLTSSGNTNKDLWIYEIGDKFEAAHVSISRDGINWTAVGDAPGGKYGIDIDAFIGKGIVAWAPYRYVRLVDVNLPHLSFSPWAGADIDAIAGFSTKRPVVATMPKMAAAATPEPSLMLMLMLGIGLLTAFRISRTARQ